MTKVAEVKQPFSRLCAILLFAGAVVPADSAIWYVNVSATGAGYGMSWASAFTNLQSAISASAEGDQIWVAKGEYRPTDTSNRDLSFTPKANTSMLGGFAGHETDLASRNPLLNETVLSGDIGISGNFSDNARHIVKISAATGIIIDGFLMTKGTAQLAGFDGGGAVMINSGTLDLRNCVIVSNYAWSVYCFKGSLNVSNCTFRFNEGGIAGVFATEITGFNSTFQSNSMSGDSGAAVNLYDTENALFDYCSFIDNSSAGDGGALFFSGGTSSIKNCVFTRNTAKTFGSGGAIASYGVLDVAFCSFESNEAYHGGAIKCSGSKPLFVFNSVFSGNRTTTGNGGAINFSHASASSLVFGNVFHENEAWMGGAIYCDNASPSIVNCTVVRNRVRSGSGGGMSIFGDSSPQVKNSIIWENTPDGNDNNRQIYKSPSSAIVLSTCLLQGGFNGGENLMDFNPMFWDPDYPAGRDNVYGTTDDGFQMQGAALALDRGSNSFIVADLFDLNENGVTNEPVAMDITKRPRVSGVSVDLGAYEFPGYTAIPVITRHPTNQTVNLGSNATFNVSAAATAPISYQWRFNGSPLSQATNSSLTISNVQFSSQGDYSILVTNVSGSATSVSARLTVKYQAKYAGVYSGAFGGPQDNGSLAMMVRSNGTSTMLAVDHYDQIGDRKLSFQVNPEGTFSFTSDLWTANCYGTMDPVIGSFSGPFGSGTVSASRQACEGSFQNVAGYYVGQVSGSLNGPAYAIVGGGGFAFLMLEQNGNKNNSGGAYGMLSGSDPISFSPTGLVPNDLTLSGSINPTKLVFSGNWSHPSVGFGSFSVARQETLPRCPPVFNSQPTNQVVSFGNNAALAASASGSQPLAYQWRKGGTSMLEFTNTSLVITTAKNSDAGFYDVVVSNDVGVAVSRLTTLTVLPAYQRILELRPLSSGQYRLAIEGSTGGVFRLDGSSNLNLWTWILTQTNVAGSTAITNSPPSNPSAYFFRTVPLP